MTVESSSPAVPLRVVTPDDGLSGAHRRGHGAQHAGSAKRRNANGRQAALWRHHVSHVGHGARAVVHAVIRRLGAQVHGTNVEPLGAAIFHVPEGVGLAKLFLSHIPNTVMVGFFLTFSECPCAQTFERSNRTCVSAPGGARSGGDAGGPSCAQTSWCSQAPDTGRGTRASRRVSPCGP